MTQLRAASRPARLRLAAGDAEAGLRTLAAVHATFGEGLATADLREAGELLAAFGPG